VKWAPQLPPPRVRPRLQRAATSPTTPLSLNDSPPHSLNGALPNHPDECPPTSSAAAPAHLGLTSPLSSASTSERPGSRPVSGRRVVSFATQSSSVV
jgi:hypothetical protein